MRTHRLVAAAALAASAVLALTACGPDETPAAAPKPSGAASSPAAGPSSPAAGAPTGAGTSAPSAKPTGVKPSASKPAPSGTPACAANAAKVGRVIEVTSVQATGLQAKEAKFVCGPDVPDDGYFQGYGNAAPFTFAPDVKTVLLHGITPSTVPLSTFTKHAQGCVAQQDDPNYECFGNHYVITVTGNNEITSITSLYHP